MKEIYPKEFINDTLIEGIGKIIKINAYLSFILIANGIEFLGKCIDTNNQAWHWNNKYSRNNQPFDNAIKKLFPSAYAELLKEGLRDQLRNGMSHTLLPKSKIGLSELKNDPNASISYSNHPFYNKNRRQHILILEYFYFDFVEACKKVISKKFESDKMNKPFLSVG